MPKVHEECQMQPLYSLLLSLITTVHTCALGYNFLHVYSWKHQQSQPSWTETQALCRTRTECCRGMVASTSMLCLWVAQTHQHPDFVSHVYVHTCVFVSGTSTGKSTHTRTCTNYTNPHKPIPPPHTTSYIHMYTYMQHTKLCIYVCTPYRPLYQRWSEAQGQDVVN